MPAAAQRIILAMVAILMSGSGATHGQGILPQPGAVNDLALAPKAPARQPLEIGDKLKISFYETIDMAPTKPGARDGELQGALRTFYQRMDLGGEYLVEQDGTISIPLLGKLQAEGRTADEARSDLATAFVSVIGRNASIDLKIVDRSPVYVVGPVKNPGAYKHVPRMIVLHAVALAGGVGDTSASGAVEGAREMERLRTTTLQLKQLLARRARLEADRDGIAASPLPIQLAKLAGEKTAQTFLDTENAILRAEQSKREQQGREIAARLAAARNEVDALKRKLEQSNAQKDMRVERLNDLQKLKERGLVTGSNVIALRTELSDIEARRQDYLVSIAQAETRLAEVEEASPRLSSENAASLANAMVTVDKEIAAAKETMVSARGLLSLLAKPGAGMPQAYEIVRQSKDGAMTLQATETTPLMPGDVLKISVSASASVTPTALSPTLPSETNLQYISAANRE